MLQFWSGSRHPTGHIARRNKDVTIITSSHAPSPRLASESQPFPHLPPQSQQAPSMDPPERVGCPSPGFEGGDAGSDEAEMKKVALMRTVVEAQDPEAKEVDDLMLRRFLRARELDIKKASNLFLKYLKWRRVAVPKGFISESEVQNELSQKKFFMQGFDKQQRPIAVLFGARHYYSMREMDEFKRYVVYVLEKLCSGMPRGQEKFVCIGDLQGWGYSNCDIRAYLAALDIMQNYYPERLGKVFLIHVPSIFMKAWKIVYPFIDKNTKKKFVFVEDKNLEATLLEDIDESQLPEIYGGKLPLCPIE